MTTLARVVARVREEATDELYATLAGLPSAHLLVVPVGARYSDLERWRKDPAKPSRRNLEKALNGGFRSDLGRRPENVTGVLLRG